MRDLGYVEGKNIFVEYRWAEGEPTRMPDLAAELTRLNVDVVFASGTQATFAVKSATTATPVVFTTHADPVEAGFVSSLGRPDGTFSGLTLMAPELVGKRLALLKEAVPTARSVAVLVNTANPGMQSTLRHLQAGAPNFGGKMPVLDAHPAPTVQ